MIVPSGVGSKGAETPRRPIRARWSTHGPRRGWNDRRIYGSQLAVLVVGKGLRLGSGWRCRGGRAGLGAGSSQLGGGRVHPEKRSTEPPVRSSQPWPRGPRRLLEDQGAAGGVQLPGKSAGVVAEGGARGGGAEPQDPGPRAGDSKALGRRLVRVVIAQEGSRLRLVSREERGYGSGVLCCMGPTQVPCIEPQPTGLRLTYCAASFESQPEVWSVTVPTTGSANSSECGRLGRPLGKRASSGSYCRGGAGASLGAGGAGACGRRRSGRGRPRG